MLKGKTIIFGVSSSIAAYKACEVVSQLKKLEADVWVAMTKDSSKLVSPLTFRTLSGNPVILDLFSEELSKLPVPHIALTQKADLMVIAPCSANILGKLAGGIADDALTTMFIASKAKKVLAPAMNSKMWRNNIVFQNVEKLKASGYLFIGPEDGRLACGDDDIGRMSEPEDIVKNILSLLVPNQDLAGRHILVTAGRTQEAIDPVRYISNRSSGKMGYALAKAARERGASVTLVSGPANVKAPLDIKPVKVESAGGMLEAVLDYYNSADALIMAAAVSDYIPASLNKKRKLKKNKNNLTLELKPSTDILKHISTQKGRKGRVLVGFALETNDLIKNAAKKMKAKDLDLIVANDNSTFDADSIKYSILHRGGEIENFPLQPKSFAANTIIDRTATLF
jgi:phosphopantothenoylcysteine decarboxylase / phosphopantothenate---cysteine ligase